MDTPVCLKGLLNLAKFSGQSVVFAVTSLRNHNLPTMSLNIERTDRKRVGIVGGGFGGLKRANELHNSGFQVILIDRNNYHQFPPLIYQVAASGLEPSSIAFPFRKLFKRNKDIYFRLAEVRFICPE